MSGTDTARGINFQYACALGIVVDFPEHSDWQTIQLEGDEDIEDVQVFDGDSCVVFRAQIKQKIDPEQWQPHEFRDVLLAFSATPDSDRTHYRFIYSGADGRDLARKVKPSLETMKYEGQTALPQPELSALHDLLSAPAVSFLLKVGSRFDWEKRETWESLREKDLRRIRKLVRQSRALSSDEDLEERIYDNLFQLIAKKTELSIKYQRRLTRKEIFDLLQIKETTSDQFPLDRLQYADWIKANAKASEPLVSLQLDTETVAPGILSFTVSVTSETEHISGQQLPLFSQSRTLHEMVSQVKQLVLVGEAGSGKTVSLWQLACDVAETTKSSVQASALGQLPLYINLAGYVGEPLPELMHRAFAASSQIMTPQAIEDLAYQGNLLLLIDDFDLVKESFRADLLLRLKSWISVHRTCSVVVTTHRASDGHNLQLPTFHIRLLDTNQAKQVLLGLHGISESDAFTIIHGLPTESQHLTTIPLLLHMLAYVYVRSEHQLPRSIGPLYKEAVAGILALSERKGLIQFDRSDKIGLFSLLAKWMQDNESYVVSPAKMSSLMSGWINDDEPGLSHLKSCDQLRLRTELIQSGLLHTSVDGDLEFIHSTFRSYFAALTISNDLSPLVDKRSWRTSLVLWASLQDRQGSDTLVETLVGQPLFLGRVILERSDKRSAVIIQDDELPAYFERLFQLLVEFVQQFPVLLHDPPWKSLSDNRLKLIVTRSSSGSFTLIWQRSEKPGAHVEWATNDKLLESAANTDKGFPLPVWLLPKEFVEKFHPLELIYIWTMRSLFDLLAFASWQGGLDVTTFGQNSGSHPFIPLIINRFLFYQEFASSLPTQIRDLLPFYAQKEYDLAIEVLENTNPPFVRYAIAPGHRHGHIEIIQSIINDVSQNASIFKEENGRMIFEVGGTPHPITSIETVSGGELMTNPPDSWARQQLKNDLEQFLLGFPPQAWL